MTLTFIIDNIPAHQRAAALHYGKRDGHLVTIEATDLFKLAPCVRCGGSHDVARCPIPANTSPEIERRKAKAGGCCGPP